VGSTCVGNQSPKSPSLIPFKPEKYKAGDSKLGSKKNPVDLTAPEGKAAFKDWLKKYSLSFFQNFSFWEIYLQKPAGLRVSNISA
jgi:hypothetical protein